MDNINNRISEACSLLDEGRFEEAIEKLEEMLSENPENKTVRMILAEVYEARKNEEKHIRTLRGGLRTSKELDSDEKKEEQIQYLSMLGDFYFSLAEGISNDRDHHEHTCDHEHCNHDHHDDGPTFEEILPDGEKDESEKAKKPKMSEEEKEIYKKEKYELALKHYEDVLFLLNEIQPGEELRTVNILMARVYEGLGRYKEALPIWELFERRTKEPEFVIKKIDCLVKMGEVEGRSAASVIEEMLLEDPRNVILYVLLEEHHKKKGEEEKRKEVGEKKFFYAHLPKFCRTLSYNAKNLRILRSLFEEGPKRTDPGLHDNPLAAMFGFPNMEKIDEKDPEYQKFSEEEKKKEKRISDVLRELADDKSMFSTEMILAFCCNHEHHGTLGNIAFSALEERLSDPEVNKLVYEMLNDNECGCTIKLLEILTNVKDEKVFDSLVSLLDSDTGFQPLGIPDFMVKLGNKSCVEHLMKRIPDIDGSGLDAGTGTGDVQPFLSMGGDNLKHRCILALSSFSKEVEEVDEFLRKGLKNPKYSFFCAVGILNFLEDETPEEVVKTLKESLVTTSGEEGRNFGAVGYNIKIALDFLGKKEAGSSKVVDGVLETMKLIMKENKEKEEKFIEEEEERERMRMEKEAELRRKYGAESKAGFSEVVAQNVCTYQITGKIFTKQNVYKCSTCELVGNLGCCETCVKTCHEGHDVEVSEGSPGMFYCDCGVRGPEKCDGMKNKYVEKEKEDNDVNDDDKKEDLGDEAKGFFREVLDQSKTSGGLMFDPSEFGREAGKNEIKCDEETRKKVEEAIKESLKSGIMSFGGSMSSIAAQLQNVLKLQNIIQIPMLEAAMTEISDTGTLEDLVEIKYQDDGSGIYGSGVRVFNIKKK